MTFDDFDSAIIDLDGTLIDTIGDFDFALNATLVELELPRIDASTIGRLVGKGSEHLIASVLCEVRGGREPDAALYEQAWARYQHHYLAINGEYARIFPGVEEGLDALAAAGLRLACLTNKPTAFTLPLLARTGLAPRFEVVRGGDAFERKKPDPLPLTRTCEALGSRPARTLMVGDSSNDARAARAAGCPVVLMSYGYNHGEPVQAVDADGVFESIAQLALRLERAAA